MNYATHRFIVEIRRLSRSLDALAQTLEMQREMLAHTLAERDDLRAELDVANTKIACLALALREARTLRRKARILDTEGPGPIIIH